MTFLANADAVIIDPAEVRRWSPDMVA